VLEGAGEVRRTGGQRRTEGGVVLRRWAMPVRTVVLCLTVWPLTGAVLLAGVLSVVPGWDSPAGDLALGIATIGLYLCGAVCALRALRARVVVSADGVRVHNVLSTRWISWTDVRDVEEIEYINPLAFSGGSGTAPQFGYVDVAAASGFWHRGATIRNVRPR
jgi:Bacterial PH domain